MSVFNDLKKLLHSKFPLSLFLLISFTLLPINSFSHFLIISEAWSATYYVDATNRNDTNNGLSESTAWKTIAKINASVFNPGDQILFKGGRFGEGNLSFLLHDKKPNRLSMSSIHLSMPDTLFSFPDPTNKSKYCRPDPTAL
jgi:hypothetical protein